MEYIRTEVVNDKLNYDESSDAFSEFQGTKLWARRSLLYRLSFLALVPLFGVFLLGFSSPFWMKKHQVDKYRGYYNVKEKVDVSIGLWRVCEGTDFTDITDCTVIPDITAYIEACQALLCLCLIFAVFALIVGLYENCATRYDMDDGSEFPTKRPEMNAVMAGLFGLTGVSMYGATIIDAARNGEGAVHWAFPVTAASVTGVIVCGILMAIANPMHSTMPNYPGQIIDMSSQNSPRSREPTVQDRLVPPGEPGSHGNAAQATTYGVTKTKLDVKSVSFLQRSDSCLSSHVSSPDLFSSISQELGLPHGQRTTHVVQACDIHSRAHDAARKQWAYIRQHVTNKAGQRRSWHFDDRNGTYILNDLMNSQPFTSSSSPTKSNTRSEDVKAALSQSRDKLSSSGNQSGPSTSPVLQVIPDETPDLLMLDDPVVSVSSKEEERFKATARTEDVVLPKRNTNPFMDECRVTPPNLLADLQRSTISSGSWENQPWPDPPSESEILGQTAQIMLNDNSSTSGSSVSNSSRAHMKILPESLQYQPQSSSLRKHDQGHDSKVSYTTLKCNDVQPSKGCRTKHGRKSPSKKSPSPQEAVKEYDNPLFKSHSPERDAQANLGENFPFQICESTSFVRPSPERSQPPSYFTLFNVQNESLPCKPLVTHQVYCQPVEYRAEASQPTLLLSLDKNGGVLTPIYNRFGKRIMLDKRAELKEVSRSNSTRSQDRKSGGIVCRPRLVKQQSQQKRSGHPETTKAHQQPPSPRIGTKNVNADLARGSPRLPQRKPEGHTAGHGPGPEDHKRSVRGKTSEQHSRHAGDINRQYYKIQPGKYRQLGDSDL